MSPESFAGGVGVAAARWLGAGWWPGRCATAGQLAAVGVGEHEGLGAVGVAGDAEPAQVVEAVVARAHAEQVPRLGRAVPAPVVDVVDLHAPAGTTGDPAATVVAVQRFYLSPDVDAHTGVLKVEEIRDSFQP